jgi:hypothetical protein
MRVSTPIKADPAGGRRRLAPALLLGLALAGCAAPPVRRTDIPDFGEVKAVFALGQDIQVIEVRSLDRLPLTAVVLVLPDGQRVEAYSLDQQRNPSLSDRTSLATTSGFVTGVGGGVPLLTGPGMAQNTTTLIGQIASTALIRVPDLATYRASWSGAKIEAHMGFAPDDRLEILQAPQPG